MNNFNNLWSVVSTVIAVGLLCWDIWQLSSYRKNKEINEKEKEIHKSQVKLWQHHASGLMHGIIALVQEEYSSVQDIKQAAKVAQSSAYSLYTSLNEERLFTEEEIKAKQLRVEAEFNKARNVNETGNIRID